ncbi:Calcineurin subunit B [Dictyocoela roeselum]|nr:Calcineurin subunit B [Dictyocoela roeselum]
MGGHSSSILYLEEIEDLEKATVFSHTEIENIYERFKMIDRSNSGQITLQNLLMIPEFTSNPLSYRFIHVLEQYAGDEQITFPVFLDLMQVFSPKYDREKRIKFVFKIFDVNNDGKLCKNVFLKLFKGFVPSNSQAINEIFIYYDPECKGYLDFKDFYRFYVKNDYDKLFTLNFDSAEMRRVDNDIFSFF